MARKRYELFDLHQDTGIFDVELSSCVKNASYRKLFNNYYKIIQIVRAV